MNELQVNEVQEELIKIQNDNGELKISGRELRKTLKIEKDFTDWIKNN